MFNDYTLSILFALVTAIMWGLGPVLFKKSYEKVSAYFSYSFDGVFGGTLLMIPFALILGVEWSKIFLATLFTLPYSVTYLMYLKAFEFKGSKAGVVSVILQTYPIFTIFATVILGHDALKLGHYVSILVIISATVMLAATEEQTSFTDIIKNGKTKWFKFSLITAILIGLGDIILDKGIELYSSGTSIMAIYITQVIVILALAFMKKYSVDKDIKTSLTDKVIFRDLLGASACMTIGAIAFYLAFEYGPVQIVSPIAGIAPVFTIIAASYFLNEKITKKEVALIGVILTYLTILTV